MIKQVYNTPTIISCVKNAVPIIREIGIVGIQDKLLLGRLLYDTPAWNQLQLEALFRLIYQDGLRKHLPTIEIIRIERVLGIDPDDGEYLPTVSVLLEVEYGDFSDFRVCWLDPHLFLSHIGLQTAFNEMLRIAD